MTSSPVAYTIGHSTRTLEAFVQLLQEHDVGLLADVRRYPGSRRHPHFDSAVLAGALGSIGISYHHLEALGGRRSPRPDSGNTAWRTAGFRGYADYLQTDQAEDALMRLLEWVAARGTALMCAEAVPWRCHRQLLADWLVLSGVSVRHILGPGQTLEHEPHPAARRGPGGRLAYPGDAASQLRLFDR